MAYNTRARDLDNKWKAALLCLLYGSEIPPTSAYTGNLEGRFVNNWLQVLAKQTDDLVASDYIGACHTCKQPMTKKDLLDVWAWLDALWKEPAGATMFTRVTLEADATNVNNTCVECYKKARILVAMKCDS